NRSERRGSEVARGRAQQLAFTFGHLPEHIDAPGVSRFGHNADRVAVAFHVRDRGLANEGPPRPDLGQGDDRIEALPSLGCPLVLPWMTNADDGSVELSQ